MSVDNIDLTKYSIEELKALRNKIERRIDEHDDGYLYICLIRSFGSVYEQKYNSIYPAEELCGSYNGDNGIVDVYTTNPNKNQFSNFYTEGGLYFIESEEDFRKWAHYTKFKNLIKRRREDLKEWEKWDENRKSGIYRYEPYKPSYKKEDLDKEEEELNNMYTDFVEPKSIWGDR